MPDKGHGSEERKWRIGAQHKWLRSFVTLRIGAQEKGTTWTPFEVVVAPALVIVGQPSSCHFWDTISNTSQEHPRTASCLLIANQYAVANLSCQRFSITASTVSLGQKDRSPCTDVAVGKALLFKCPHTSLLVGSPDVSTWKRLDITGQVVDRLAECHVLTRGPLAMRTAVVSLSVLPPAAWQSSAPVQFAWVERLDPSSAEAQQNSWIRFFLGFLRLETLQCRRHFFVVCFKEWLLILDLCHFSCFRIADPSFRHSKERDDNDT